MSRQTTASKWHLLLDRASWCYRLWGSGQNHLRSSSWKAVAHCAVALCYCFQFKMSLSKAAENLVHLSPKCLRKPQSQPQPQMAFPAVRLRHVEGARREATLHPPPESEDTSAASSSCRSAVQFMSRVLQRLREVDEHVYEVMTVSCFFFFFFSPVHVSALSAAFSDAQTGPRFNTDDIWCWIYTKTVMCSQNMRSAPKLPIIPYRVRAGPWTCQEQIIGQSGNRSACWHLLLSANELFRLIFQNASLTSSGQHRRLYCYSTQFLNNKPNKWTIHVLV